MTEATLHSRATNQFSYQHYVKTQLFSVLNKQEEECDTESEKLIGHTAGFCLEF